MQGHHTWEDIVEQTDSEENSKAQMKLQKEKSSVAKVPTDQNAESVAIHEPPTEMKSNDSIQDHVMDAQPPLQPSRLCTPSIRSIPKDAEAVSNAISESQFRNSHDLENVDKRPALSEKNDRTSL